MNLPKTYRRDCFLGALGAALMLVGDLCLSVIPAIPGDSGLFLREAYIAPAMLLAYAGMIALILCSAWAVLTKKTVLPRKMFIFHMLVWQIVFMIIPDIRIALGAQVCTADFVLSQGSGNAALLIWMLANAIWSGRSKA